jgi:uncharacterized protein YjbJ (UPF0337 family)
MARRGFLMSFLDKAKDKAEQLVGDAKEKIGELTGNDSLRAEGQGEQAAGHVKEAGHDLKDKAAGAAEDVKDKFK